MTKPKGFIKTIGKGGRIKQSIVIYDAKKEIPIMDNKITKKGDLLVLNYPNKGQRIHYFRDKNNEIKAVLTDERLKKQKEFNPAINPHSEFNLTFSELRNKIIKEKEIL